MVAAELGRPRFGGAAGNVEGATGGEVAAAASTILPASAPSAAGSVAARAADRGSHRDPAAALAGAGVRAVRSAAFLAAWADVSRTRTLTGYNPLLEDYANTRILLT
jgi:hypothetical protein